MPNTYAEYIQSVDKTNNHKKHENMHLMELFNNDNSFLTKAFVKNLFNALFISLN